MTFEEFATARLRPLLRVATAICGDPSLAEDLVQEVLIKAHARWERVEAAREPDAYVRRMLVNEYISWRRRWARILPSARIEVPDEPDHAARQADRDEVTGLLERLPRRQQVVLALRYYGGLDDAEIAEAMGCSAGTVRGYASRALARLREMGDTEISSEPKGADDDHRGQTPVPLRPDGR
jgi:RNA polymerase sigma-70 factor (sigma-E family)